MNRSAITQLEYLEEVTSASPQLIIIWLHGLGANGFDFQPIAQQLNLPADCAAHFIFPHAPLQAVTLNQGMEMPAWFDIYELSLDTKEDAEGIQAATQAIEALLREHAQPTQKLILAGFSQGGAVAINALLRGQVEWDGIIALSTYLPIRNQAFTTDPQRLQSTPVFIGHGSYDDVLPCEIGKMAKTKLEELSVPVEWHTYPMPHSVCNDEITDIRNWLLTHFYT